MSKQYLNDAFFSRLETLSLNLRADLSGYFGGKHLVKTHGQTVEFSDFREYQLGDDIRRIDWNLFSRFEKYFLKLFTDERQMHVQVFLDCSASMGRDLPDKAAYSTAVAAALGFLAVQSMDKLSFNFMRGRASENPFGTIVGKNSFFRAISRMDGLEFDGEADIEQCVISSDDAGQGNGISVIISDFLTDSNWKKAVDYLVYKHRQVLLIQVLTPQEISPDFDGRVHLIDSETPDLLDDRNLKIKVTKALLLNYDRALADLKQDMLSFCNKREAGFISVRTDKPIEDMLFKELLRGEIIS